MSDKPTISQRDLSYNEALAGIQAKALAERLGGDAGQIQAILITAAAEVAARPELAPKQATRQIGGHSFPLRMTLAMTLAYQALMARTSPEDTSAEAKTRQLCRTALVCGQPALALDALRADDGLATLDAEAVAFAGGWSLEDVDAFGSYMQELIASQGATPGKPPATPPRKPGRR